jgi:hypothetical protein
LDDEGVVALNDHINTDKGRGDVIFVSELTPIKLDIWQ